jgi:hypothetical protein
VELIGNFFAAIDLPVFGKVDFGGKLDGKSGTSNDTAYILCYNFLHHVKIV